MGIVKKDHRDLVVVEKTFLTANAGLEMIGAAPCNGEIVAIEMAQGEPGTVGTDVSVQVARRRAGVSTDVLATQGKVTRAAGYGVAVDSRKKIAAVAGCTRPVLSATKATRRVKRGDFITVTATETGAYTVHPTVAVTVFIRSDD